MIATAGSAQKCAACVRLGADAAIDYKSADFVTGALDATQGRGVDVILDMVGGDYVARDIAAAAPEGRIAVIATQGGRKAEIDLAELMGKRLMIGGSTLRPQTIERKGELAAALRKQIWPLLETGAVRLPIHARFPLSAAAEAHALMESGGHVGKIVLNT